MAPLFLDEEVFGFVEDIQRTLDMIQGSGFLPIGEVHKNGGFGGVRHRFYPSVGLRRMTARRGRSHSFERHDDTFHIHGNDAKSGMDQALKVSAPREGQDRIRYGQGSQQ